MEIVRCRIKRYEWWTVPGCFFLAGLMLFVNLQGAKEQPDAFWAMWIMSSLMVLICSAGAFWVTRSLLYQEIIADPTGLRWRNPFGPWKSARWDEISDFSFTGLKQLPTIQTPSGKITLITELANRESMMATVAERAVNAPARVWEKEKFRASKNLTQRFNYWTKSHQWMAPILTVGSICVAAALCATLFDSKPISSPRQLRWSLDLFSILMILTNFAPLFVVTVASLWTIWRERNFALARHEEHLEISPRGLAWQNGKSRIEANWDEVHTIHFVSGDRQTAHFQVETQNGDFPVWRSLESISLWVQLVNQFAPHLAPEIPITHPALGGESATWSGGVVGQGARIFHYRTRDTRMVLWCVTAFGLILPALPLLMQSVKTPDDDPSTVPVKLICIALFLIVLALIYAWLCFRYAAIWADETGLEWRVPLLKTRRINWGEIESFGSDEGKHFLTVGGKKRRLFLISTLVRQNELRELIQSRAINAHGKWN